MTRTDTPIIPQGQQAVADKGGKKDLSPTEKSERAATVKRAAGTVLKYLDPPTEDKISPIVRNLVGVFVKQQVLNESEKGEAARSADYDFSHRMEHLFADREKIADQIRDHFIELVENVSVMATREVTLPGNYSAMETAQIAANYRPKMTSRIAEIAIALRSYIAGK